MTAAKGKPAPQQFPWAHRDVVAGGRWLRGAWRALSQSHIGPVLLVVVAFAALTFASGGFASFLDRPASGAWISLPLVSDATSASSATTLLESSAPHPSLFCDALARGSRYGLPPSSFFRIFWPDRAEFMVLPQDSRRTGTKCAARMVDSVHSAVVTVVTEAWLDSDVWRLEAMAQSLLGQSYRIDSWWVLFLASSSSSSSSNGGRALDNLQGVGDAGAAHPQPHRPKTMTALRRVFKDARVVVGSGSDLARAMRDDARTYNLGVMPVRVLVDENFNAILEHTAVEKLVWALEGHEADAVSSWSVTFDTEERAQHLTTRTPHDREGVFMMRSSDPAFWSALERLAPQPSARSVASGLLCDPTAQVVILPEHLFWEDAAAGARRSPLVSAAAADHPQCVPLGRKRELSLGANNATDAVAMGTWRKLTRARLLREPSDCGHAASMLLVVPWLEYGGADQFNVNLVRNLARPYNIHVVVVTTTDGSPQPLFGDVAAVTEDVFHINHLLLPAWKKPKLTVADAITYMARTRGADVLLLSNSEPGYLSLPELRPRLPDVAFLDYVHSIALDWRNGGYARYSVESHRWLDRTLVSSNGLRGWMEEQGRPAADAYGAPVAYVAYVGVAPRECRRIGKHERASIRARYGVGAASPLIVFPARMSPEKNPGRFFAIVERVLHAHPEAVVIAVGGGLLLDELRANITRSGLAERLISTGALAHQDTLEVLQAADIMMLTSNYEGISLSIFEGMAAGVVPFSTDVGAQHELVTADTGVLITLDDNVVDAFAKALNALLDSPSTLAKMKDAAHARILAGFDVAHVPRRIRAAVCSVAFN